jgi:uncharacterized protein YkwD/uncharacterized membrane protein required for colicin V production
MEPLDLLQRLNWLDWILLAGLLLAAWSGIRRGFVLGALDLLAIAVSLAVAILAYRAVADWLTRTAGLPQILASIGALVGLLVFTQFVYWLVVGQVLHLGSRIGRHLRPLRPVDQALGVVPGLARGLLWATLILLTFTFTPFLPAVTRGLEGSTLAGRLVDEVMRHAPALEAQLGRDLEGGLPFLTPTQPDESRQLPLGALGQLNPFPEAEQQMFELVNRERTSSGLRPLQFDEALRDVARAHSREMFERRYFSHTSPETGSPFDRLRRAGIPFLIAGENLAFAPTVQLAHQGLMNSPGHRANILRPQFGRVGIGVIRSQFQGMMFTQKFRN